MAPETAEMRPPRNGPRLRQTSPERRLGATGARPGAEPANAPSATSSSETAGSRSGMDVRAVMSDNSRVVGVAARNHNENDREARQRRHCLGHEPGQLAEVRGLFLEYA